jgi:hypothetical protein
MAKTRRRPFIKNLEREPGANFDPAFLGRFESRCRVVLGSVVNQTMAIRINQEEVLDRVFATSREVDYVMLFQYPCDRFMPVGTFENQLSLQRQQRPRASSMRALAICSGI